jgi:hypothetical protein
MLAKIREFAETVKAVLMWILAPLLIIGGLIYEVLVLKDQINRKAKRDEGEAKAQEAKAKAEQSVKESNDAEEDYKRIRDRVLADEPDGGGDGSLPPAG